MPSSISQALAAATETLRKSGIAEPQRDAKSLLAFAIGKDLTFLFAHSDYQLSTREEDSFAEILARRAGREPLQYIKGKTEFFGLEFFVSPDVLIPRPETELLVEAAIEILHEKPKARFCEIGIGSGCISISILHTLNNVNSVGLDISEAALAIARRNAVHHQIADSLELRMSNVFDRLRKGEKFDLILANPPYVPLIDFEGLQAEVRDYEPRIALTDESDGLSIIARIISESPRFMNSNAFLLMEIGFNQSSKALEMLSESVWESCNFLPDLQGIPRLLRVKLR